MGMESTVAAKTSKKVLSGERGTNAASRRDARRPAMTCDSLVQPYKQCTKRNTPPSTEAERGVFPGNRLTQGTAPPSARAIVMSAVVPAVLVKSHPAAFCDEGYGRSAMAASAATG